MQPYIENPFTSKKIVYRLKDLLNVCKASDLNLIIFKNIVFQAKPYGHNKTKILTVDTRYPIIVALKKDNKYHIVDGNHRYLKMKLENKTACLAFVVTPEHLTQIKDSWSSYPVTKTSCSGCEE